MEEREEIHFPLLGQVVLNWRKQGQMTGGAILRAKFHLRGSSAILQRGSSARFMVAARIRVYRLCPCGVPFEIKTRLRPH